MFVSVTYARSVPPPPPIILLCPAMNPTSSTVAQTTGGNFDAKEHIYNYLFFKKRFLKAAAIE